MKIARIDAATGEVINTELWAQVPDDTAEHLFRELTQGAGIGCTWDGEAFVFPPAPEPPRRLIPKSVIQERVNDVGKLGAVMAVLRSEGQEINYARWFAPDWPNVYFDDPAMLTLLAAVGCTEGEIATITAAG